jgi:hypothetical protein
MHASNISTHLMKRLRGLACALAIWSAVDGLLFAANATDGDYQRFVASAKSNLEAGKIDMALAELQQAVLMDPAQYEGFFYLAVVTFRQGDHAAALEYATSAVGAATGQDKSRAQELADAIRKAKETTDLARQGDEAQGKGLNAKAADLYARAFRLSPDRGDLGLKAATLYGNRLGRLFEAAVIYQGVIASGDATAANTAGSELGALHEPLQKLYRDELPRAAERRDLGTLEKLSKAFPHEAQPRLEVAALLAAKTDAAAVADWLGEAVKLGAGYDDVKPRTVFLDLWEKGAPEFTAFIGDAFGSAATDDMNQRLKARQAKLAEERRIAAEKARAEQAALDKKQREEQLAREQAERERKSRPLRAQLRAPVVAEIDRLLQASPQKQIRYKRITSTSAHSIRTFNVSLALKEDSYVLVTGLVEEQWGDRHGHRIHRTGTTYTINSLASLISVGTEHENYAKEYPKSFYGSAAKLRTLTAKFPSYSIHYVSHSTYASTPEPPSKTDGIYGDFFVNDLADCDRIQSLFWELKAIDSMTLEQLREKAGGG